MVCIKIIRLSNIRDIPKKIKIMFEMILDQKLTNQRIKEISMILEILIKIKLDYSNTILYCPN